MKASSGARHADLYWTTGAGRSAAAPPPRIPAAGAARSTRHSSTSGSRAEGEGRGLVLLTHFRGFGTSAAAAAAAAATDKVLCALLLSTNSAAGAEGQQDLADESVIWCR